MNPKEKMEFQELKELIRGMAGDKYDPVNGWKTERRLFEQRMVDNLAVITESLNDIKGQVSMMPDLCHEVDGLQKWRKNVNSVLKWVGTTLGGASVVGVIGVIIHYFTG